MYFDDCGDICIWVAEDCQVQCTEIMKNLDGFIHFKKGKYSFRQLNKLCAEILSASASTARGIVGAGIDGKNNRITLAVTDDFHDEETLSVRDEFSVERFEWLKTNISMQPSDRLSNGNCFFISGYPVKSGKNVRGFVTAGHLSEIEKEMPVFFDAEEIGSVRDFEFSDVMDAAFIELNDSSKCSDIVSTVPNPHINGLTPEFICGAAAEMYSSNNGGARVGRIVYPSFSFMNLKDIIVCSYSASAGDSGAPILIPFPSGEYALAGIHLGTFSLGGKVYSYGRTAESINARFSLELDIKK